MAGLNYKPKKEPKKTAASTAASVSEAKGKKGVEIAKKIVGKPKGSQTVERQLGTKAKDVLNPKYWGASYQYGATTKEKVPTYTPKQMKEIRAIVSQMLTERERSATRAAALEKKSKKK